MKGFKSLRSTSSRNLEKKKKRDGIALQSDSILDQGQVGSPPASPSSRTSVRSPSPISSYSNSSPSTSSSHGSPASSGQHSPLLTSSSPNVPSAHPHSLASLSSSTSSSLTSSPSSRSNRTTRLIGKMVVEEDPDEVGRFKLDGDSEVKNRDDQVKALKAHLKKLVTTTRRLNTDALRYSKANNLLASDGLDKMQIAEKRFNTESVYAEALTKLAEAERNVAAHVTQFHQVPSDQFIAHIVEFVDKDISTELKGIKTKYEKARREYDSAVDKVTSLRGKAKPDIIKLYNAERDLKRVKKVYEDALEEVTNKLDDIELKKSCSVLEWLILFLQQERDMYGESFAVVQHLEGYLEELTTWAADMKAFFHDSVQKRAEEQAILIQEERDAVYDPLIQLVESNPGVVAILQRIITREGKNIPMPTRSDIMGVASLHAFIREFYDVICQELILAGYKEQMKVLASAVGLLEKAKEDIEL